MAPTLAKDRNANFSSVASAKFLYKPKDFITKRVVRGKACFSYNYTMYGFKETWSEFLEKIGKDHTCIVNGRNDVLPEGKNMFHELVLAGQPVKPYLDIEFYEEHLSSDFGIADIKEHIIEAITTTFTLRFDFDLESHHIVIAECHREDQQHGFKYSFHYVINTHPRQLVFRCTSDALFFAQQVCAFLNDLGHIQDIVDLNPYKPLQNFRLPYQVKNGGSAMFVIVSKNEAGALHCTADMVLTNVDRNAAPLDVPDIGMQRSGEESNMMEIDEDRDVELLDHYARKLHPTARRKKTGVDFVNYTYDDRTEKCFLSGSVHDRLGFYCWIGKDDIIKYACHSARCRYEESGLAKDQENDRPQRVWSKSFPLAREVLTEIEYQGCVKGEVYHNATDEAMMRRFVDQQNLGLSKCFADFYLNPIRRILFDPNSTERSESAAYFFWTGRLWRKDKEDYLTALLSENIALAIKTHQLNVAEDDLEHRKMCISTISALHNGNRNKAILSFLKSQIVMDEFADLKDLNPHMLSCSNGMVNLVDGTRRPAVPTDYITKALAVEYDPRVRCEAWEQFIVEITSTVRHTDEGDYVIVPHPQKTEYLRWMVGYAMQGDPIQKKFFVLYGKNGYEGKSLLMNTILAIVEHYGVTMDETAVMEAPKRSAGSTSSELVHLMGKRIAVLADTPQDAKLGHIKQLVSAGDGISVRALYGDQQVMQPVLVPIINTNYLLYMNLEDMATFDRLSLFPFEIRFVESPKAAHERPINHALAGIFKENHQGILTWLVECSMFYSANMTMPEPAFVTRAKRAYKNRLNNFTSFMEANVVAQDGCTIGVNDFLGRFQQFCANEKCRFRMTDAKETLCARLGVGADDEYIEGYRWK